MALPRRLPLLLPRLAARPLLRLLRLQPLVLALPIRVLLLQPLRRLLPHRPKRPVARVLAAQPRHNLVRIQVGRPLLNLPARRRGLVLWVCLLAALVRLPRVLLRCLVAWRQPPRGLLVAPRSSVLVLRLVSKVKRRSSSRSSSLRVESPSRST